MSGTTPRRVPLPPMQTFTVITREVTYRTVKVRARTPQAAIERADTTDDEDTYTEGDGVESVTDEQGNDVTPEPDPNDEIPFPTIPDAAVDPSWPWCEACRSWHHPDNPTCRANTRKGPANDMKAKR
jgi:hypothetical protein